RAPSPPWGRGKGSGGFESRTSSWRTSTNLLTLPIEGPLLHRINVSDQQNRKERHHGSEYPVSGCRVRKHLLVNYRPRIKKHDFDIKKNKQHGHEVKLDGHASVSLADGQHAAFIGGVLNAISLASRAE